GGRRSPSNGQRPGEGTVIGTGLGLRIDVPKYSAMSPLSGFVGDMEYIALYAGESCTLINEIKPAAEIVRDLVREAEDEGAHFPERSSIVLPSGSRIQSWLPPAFGGASRNSIPRR